MVSVASQLIEKVTAHAQIDSLKSAREICADGIYFPNNLRIYRGSKILGATEQNLMAMKTRLTVFVRRYTGGTYLHTYI